MKIILQRVTKAKVSVEDNIVGEVNKGYVLFIGIGKKDTEEVISDMAMKIASLRVMADENGKMSRSILEVQGEILVVSQFTLYADTTGGRRPSFIDAASPDIAEKCYELFISELTKLGVQKVAKGKFGTYMQVEIHNDGPVTIILNS